MATLQWMHSDTVDVERIVKSAVHGTAIAMDLVMQWRADGTIPDDRIVDVRFDDLVGDPVARRANGRSNGSGGSLERETEQRMRGVPRRPAARAARPRTTTTSPTPASTSAETRARFAAYQARYDVPSEE